MDALDWIDRLSYPLELWLWFCVLVFLAWIEHLITRRRS